jgi:hypothetical protein
MNDADLRLLKAVRERDAERSRRIKAERAAQALKLQVGQLRRRLRFATLDAATPSKPVSRNPTEPP